MSEKKSWDIQPKRRAPEPVEPIQARRSEARAQPPPRAVQSRPAVRRRPQKVLQGQDREPLKAKRQRARKRARVAIVVLLILLIAAVITCLWLPTFRIQRVEASGPDAAAMQSIAESTLSGTQYYIFPRNSIFYFSQSAIRNQILNQYPDLSAVSISRTSFSSIALTSISRETAFIWCGPTYSKLVHVSVSSMGSSTASSTTPSANPPTTTPCYDADSEGFIYAPIADNDTSGFYSLRVYGALEIPDAAPVGTRIFNAAKIPKALQFVKAMKALGVDVIAVAIRGDEADLYSQSGTRITYVPGKEQAAAQLASSAFPTLSLNDGSLEYVDLRFDGKVYFKKIGSAAATVTPSVPATSISGH